jgi:hypothetical protein
MSILNLFGMILPDVLRANKPICWRLKPRLRTPHTTRFGLLGVGRNAHTRTRVAPAGALSREFIRLGWGVRGFVRRTKGGQGRHETRLHG